MRIGGSGRIVLEIDPGMKRRLYAILAGYEGLLGGRPTQRGASKVIDDRDSSDPQAPP